MFATRRLDSDLESLGQLALFQGCSHPELAAVGRHTTQIPLRAGTVLCREGAPGLEAFVITAGEASVSVGGSEIARLGPGDPCGEMALLEGAPRAATVTAVTPIEVLVLSPGELRSLLSAAPTITWRLLVTLSNRLRRANDAEAVR